MKTHQHISLFKGGNYFKPCFHMSSAEITKVQFVQLPPPPLKISFKSHNTRMPGINLLAACHNLLIQQFK